MRLAELQDALAAVDVELAAEDEPFVWLHRFERDGRRLAVALTPRLRRRARRARLWKHRALAITLNNAAYGFDERRARSVGGADGLYLLDRDHRPANAMMRKIFDAYLDRPESSGASDVAADLGVGLEELLAVRLVSHQLRLLGVLHRAMSSESEDRLVLVDLDR